MSTLRTQWHVFFYAMVKERGSIAAEALAEVLLSKEPQQGDILLIRRGEASDGDAKASTLKRLWPLIPREALIEYKSPSRPPRAGDVARLIGYGGQLHSLRHHEIGTFRNLLLCLVVTSITDWLREELHALDAPMSVVSPGYLLIETRPYRILVVDLTEVVRADADEWMSIFVPSIVLTPEAKHWLEEHMPAKDVPANERLEGYNEVLARLLQSTSPSEILAAAGVQRLLDEVPAEQRLAGLRPEQQVLAMPESALRALSEEYVRSLPADVQAAIRARIGTPR